MAKNPKKKIVTRKHLARVERERLQNRYIIVVAGLVILVVVIMIGYGFVEQYILQPNQPVAIVNGDEISTREFQVNVRFSRQQLITQYLQTQQFMELLGNDEANRSFFEQNLQQIRLQLESSVLPQNVLDRLIEDRLIRQQAELVGVTVSESEIDQAIQSDFNYFPAGTPTPTSTSESMATSTLSPTQLALIPPTPTDSITPTLQIVDTLEPTINPTPTTTQVPTPSPTPYTLEDFQQNYQTYLDFLNSELDMSESDLRKIYESDLFREKIFSVVTEDVEREQDQVWARHILVEDESTAQEVYEKLQNGEDFVDLAAEYSVDTSNSDNGGDLGWFGIGRMDPDFEKVAFNLNIGQVSHPFETTFGWHILQVLGHENRPLSTAEYQQLQQTKFDEWVNSRRTESDIKIFDYWTERIPTRPSLPPQASF